MLKLLTAGSALLFVVALIFATGALGRWLSPWLGARFAGNRLAASGTLKAGRGGLVQQLDPRRRLHLVELAGCQVAILTGGPNDVMIALGTQTSRGIE